MLLRAVFLLTAIVATPALAQTGAQTGERHDVSEAAFDSAGAVDDQALGTITGRENLGQMIANANQRNTVANNSVTGNSVTGSVAIDGNAFQNLQGLAVINANSGNNVAINSAMNVTINLAPMQ